MNLYTLATQGRQNGVYLSDITIVEIRMSDMQTKDAQNYTMAVDSDFQELIRDATMVALVNDLMGGEYTTLLTKSLIPGDNTTSFSAMQWAGDQAVAYLVKYLPSSNQVTMQLILMTIPTRGGGNM